MSDTTSPQLAPPDPNDFPAGYAGLSLPLPRQYPEPDALGSPVLVDNSQDATDGG